MSVRRRKPAPADPDDVANPLPELDRKQDEALLRFMFDQQDDTDFQFWLSAADSRLQTTRMRFLWCEVIRFTVLDSVCNSKSAREKARRWLSRPSRDIYEVLTLAGLEPKRFFAHQVPFLQSIWDYYDENPDIKFTRNNFRKVRNSLVVQRNEARRARRQSLRADIDAYVRQEFPAVASV